MTTNLYKSLELFILFVLLPVSLALPFDFRLKGILILFGFFYLLFVMLRIEKVSFKINKGMDWKLFWKRIFYLFIGIAAITTFYVYFIDASKLFCVPLNKPGLWLIILLVYTFLSVWPQELIYRTFFFTRYERLFDNKKLFIFVNAILFSLAHIFFRNTLVIVLTFMGGLLFGFTYLKTKSTVLVSIEHAIYGNWLFTVGMGEMLAFPGAESC